MVLPAATPRFTVSYGGWGIDESHGCLLTSQYQGPLNPTDGTFSVEFRVRLRPDQVTNVVATDDAAFGVLVAAVELNLNIPRQALLVKYGVTTIRSWDASAGSAFSITPTLTKDPSSTARNHKYKFEVSAQLPGNVPGNVFRRESLTTVGSSLRERRKVVITATWTGSSGETAYQRYLDSGDAFFGAYLPVNVTDQHGTSGTWMRADENPAFPDENGVVTATREYWELFLGRRESSVKTLSSLNGRRVCTIQGTWTASSNGHTALQNFQDNSGAYFSSVLPANVSSGFWTLYDSDPTYNDQNGLLTVTNEYREVVNGLREYSAVVTQGGSGAKTVEVSGTYYATGSSARTNYDNNIQTLVNSILAAESITVYESHSVPKITRYGETGLEYFFKWTINELCYPQGSSNDDPHVTFETLDVRLKRPFDKQSISSGNPVGRLQYGEAKFVASIDKNSSGGTDPVALWDGGLRTHVVTAITSKLGSGVSSVQVVAEDVGVGLHANQFVGTLAFVVTGGSILWLRLRQMVTQIPGREFTPLADGTKYSYFAWRVPPEKLLHREASCEYVVGGGGTPPAFFSVGDTTASGFGFIDTGKSAQDSIDAQNAAGSFTGASPDWHIDRRSPAPYSYTDEPTSQGDGGSPFNTVVHAVVEDWRYSELVTSS